MHPKAWPRDPKRIWTSDEIFEINAWPKSLAVVGLGAIGLEMADAMSALGVKVTAFGDVSLLGGLTDPDVLQTAKAYFKERFEIVNGEIKDLTTSKSWVHIHHGRKERKFEKVLLAMGRSPALDKIGFEKLGVVTDEHGMPPVDEKLLKLRGHPVYLAGDVSRQRPILHEANDQGRYVGLSVSAALRDPAAKAKPYVAKTPLSIAFTSLQIAAVGLTRKKLETAQIEFVEGVLNFRGQGRALTKMQARGLLKIYGCPNTGKIFGAEMVAPEAEHLAHLLAWSIDAGETVFDLLRKAFYHPTLEEGLRSALRDLEKKVRAKPPEAGDDAFRGEPAAGTNCP